LFFVLWFGLKELLELVWDLEKDAATTKKTNLRFPSLWGGAKLLREKEKQNWRAG